MATIYRASDSGAPAFPASSTYDGAKYIMEVLKACLVTGYGAKTAAGWTLDYEDTTTGKHRLALSNGNGVIEFITYGDLGLAAFIFDSITSPGSGRLRDDSLASVISTGVNGWASHRTEMPISGTDTVVSLYTQFLSSSNYASNNVDWTVFADDKSCWLIFHYRQGHASSDPGDAITPSNGMHPRLFFGAIKSPDLLRSQAGNFFVAYGESRQNNIAPGSSSQINISNLWGLRTPFNQPPNESNSQFTMRELSTSGQNGNPYSSVRLITPIMATFLGDGTTGPGSLSGVNLEYTFGTVPGIGSFCNPNLGTAGFWMNYALENMTWNLEIKTFNGASWMPIDLRSNLRDCGITDDAAWWA